jgi:hypothetical protein
MGSIYSQAELVHVWLGPYEGTEHIQPLVDGPSKDADNMGGKKLWRLQMRHSMHVIDQVIFQNKYWTRAWVVQEIMLARQVEVSIGRTPIRFGETLRKCQDFW